MLRPPSWRSTDLDEVREVGGRVFCPHRLDVVAAGECLDTRLIHRRAGGLGLGRLSYGATVDIDPQQLDGFYLLQWPVLGHETIHLDAHAVGSDARTGSLVSPHRRFRMRHQTGTEKLFVRIDEAALARQIEALAPGIGGRSPAFLPAVPFADPRLAPLVRLLQWLFEDSDAELPLSDNALFVAPLEEMLLRALLQFLPHDRPDLLRPMAAVAPRFVVRAEAFMAEHAHEALTGASIAAAVGVSVRSLYAGFRRYRERSPMQRLRELRLERVRAELVRPDRSTGGVGAVALRWGFGHLGEFSAAYLRRYGELPSQTLRRARGF